MQAMLLLKVGFGSMRSRTARAAKKLRVGRSCVDPLPFQGRIWGVLL
jgi:hypothetical protein